MIETNEKTIAQVFDELVDILKKDGIYKDIEYFVYINKEGKELFPRFRWVACYAVEGGNEGHYVHVDVIDIEGKRDLLYVGKTFDGIEHALKLSNVLTKAFYV